MTTFNSRFEYTNYLKNKITEIFDDLNIITEQDKEHLNTKVIQRCYECAYDITHSSYAVCRDILECTNYVNAFLEIDDGGELLKTCDSLNQIQLRFAEAAYREDLFEELQHTSFTKKAA